MKQIFISMVFSVVVLCSFAQTPFDRILSEIEKNNKELKAFRYQVESEKFRSKNEVLPPGPVLTYDRLNANEVQPGYSEMVLSQPFDFPLIYLTKIKLAKLEAEASEMSYLIKKRDVLYKAKLLLIELSYQNLMKNRLEVRLENAGRLFEMNQKRIEQGDINMIEFNKSKIQYLTIKAKYANAINELKMLSQELEVLNGGISIDNFPVDFPELESEATLKELFKDPADRELQMRSLKLGSEIVNKERKISNWDNLPSFEAGYRYDDAGEGTFSGIHLGMSIPLWNNLYNKEKCKAQAGKIMAEIDHRQTSISSELETLFNQYSEIRKLYDEFVSLYRDAEVENMLEKSLKLGQISGIDYYRELAAYYDLEDTMLAYEKELHVLSAGILYFHM